MRVCMVTGSWPNMDCGVGDYTWQLARQLAASIDVNVVTSDRPAIREFVAGSAAAQSFDLEVRPTIRDWSLRGLPALQRAVRACRPDVVHIQYATSAFDTGAAITWLAAALKRGRHRIPVVTTLHDPSGPRLFPKAGRLREAHVRMLCRGSDLVCCPDRLLREWLAANNMEDRARQVPVGVNVAPVRCCEETATGRGSGQEHADTATLRLRREYPAVFRGGPIMVSFGNLHPDKDYESVIAALQHLAAGRCEGSGPDWSRAQWVVVGGTGRGADTGRAQEVASLAAGAGLQDCVHLAGYAIPEQVSAWLDVADLCVMLLPQGATDARSSLLVALAHGKATVVVGRGVFSDAMRDGVHLCWSPAGDPARLASHLERLMRDPAQRARLGHAARELTDRHYGWPSIAEATIGIYREALIMNGIQTFGRSGVREMGKGGRVLSHLNARTPERLNAEQGGSP